MDKKLVQRRSEDEDDEEDAGEWEEDDEDSQGRPEDEEHARGWEEDEEDPGGWDDDQDEPQELSEGESENAQGCEGDEGSYPRGREDDEPQGGPNGEAKIPTPTHIATPFGTPGVRDSAFTRTRVVTQEKKTKDAQPRHVYQSSSRGSHSTTTITTASNNSTMLHNAIKQGNVNTAIQIIRTSNRQTRSTPDSSGRTPLHLACQYRQKETVRALIREGFQRGMKDHNGFIPLHTAAAAGDQDIVKFLLDAGAITYAKDNRGRTPQRVARDYNNWAVANLIAHYERRR